MLSSIINDVIFRPNNIIYLFIGINKPSHWIIFCKFVAIIFGLDHIDYKAAVLSMAASFKHMYGPFVHSPPR